MSINRCVLYAFAPNNWHGPWMSRQQILSRLSLREWEIVYSTGLFNIWDMNSEKTKSSYWLTRWTESAGIKVVHSGKLPFRCNRIRKFDRFALKQHITFMRKAALYKRTKDIQEAMYIFHPSYYPYVEQSKIKNVVYHVYDAFSIGRSWNENLVKLEKLLVRKASVIFAVTQQMADLLPDEAQDKTYIVPNGANTKLFLENANEDCPEDLKNIPRPRIGYVGNVTPKVDLQLVADIAKKRPDWQWVFVGRVVPKSQSEWKDEYSWRGWVECQKRKNIHFLGEKPYYDLPAYMGNIDVNTMCYRSRGKGWWQAGYPLKLHEYLAVGKPIVSADIEAVRPFSYVCDIAVTTDEWIQSIERAFQGGVGTVADRQEVAKNNSWEQRVNTIENILKNTFDIY